MNFKSLLGANMRGEGTAACPPPQNPDLKFSDKVIEVYYTIIQTFVNNIYIMNK